MKRILIAEDDARVGSALEIRLKAAAYEVLVVPDGFRSFLRAMTWKPDLILMDIFMPTGSGLDVARELARVGLAGIPIIFITASKQKDLREKAKRLNAVGFIEKPFDAEKVLAAIDRALGSKQLLAESIPLEPADG